MGTQIVRFDDLDGSTGEVTTLHFWIGYDGRAEFRQIDLSADNLSDFVNFMERYDERSRPSTPLQAKAKTGAQDEGASKVPENSAEDVRNWLRDHGYKVSERGRIPANLVKVYAEAHKKSE